MSPVARLKWSVFLRGGFTAKIDAHLRKNRLKRPKIRQGTTSKVNYNLFNRLLSPVPLNKSSLAQAKAQFNFLNRCFSNYYQVRTTPVFAEMVTYVTFPGDL